MRGADVTQEGLFVMKQTVNYVPADHPLIAIRKFLNAALREMDRLFESMYESRGRYSVAPERLLRRLVLQAQKWPRLFEQLSPIYKWNSGGSRKVQGPHGQR